MGERMRVRVCEGVVCVVLGVCSLGRVWSGVDDEGEQSRAEGV